MGNLSLRSRLFFLSFVISQLMFITTTSQPDFFYYICSNEANYTNNSPFKKNLDNVLASISSSSNNTDSRRVDYGFYNATSGEDPDTANGKVLCRKGVPLEQCRSCVNDSVRRITQNCPTQKEGAGWYHDCQILYSNNSVHDETDLSVNQIYYNLVTAPDKNSFNEDLRGLLDRLREEAASGTSIRKSAGGDVKLKNPNMYTIYGLVDCFPTCRISIVMSRLSRLQSYLPTCCTGSIGAEILAASVAINYEHPLYESLLSPPRPLLPPPPPLSAPNLPPPSSLSTQGNNGNTVRTVIIVVVSVASAIILIAGICLILRLRNRKQKRRLRKFESVAVEDASDEISSIETIQFDFDVIKVATNDFSSENKLGQGGFGPVYMGKLPNGQHIAVKRLAHNSQQGNAECKNEVLLLVKLQHRNLVRLLGFCLQGSERLLIYEFVPNGSLDHFLFDLEKRTQLSWERRYKIINGIARGLLYLHEDSRLRIIHRDLKASNILLDEEMNPKIADFGLARLFQIDETQGNTNRIVGTYGYMAPEYVVHGQFSVKSDVFSFGVLVLEIVSGKKNKCFCNEENIEDLPSFTWNNWRAGTTTNAIDSTLNVGSRIEMIRCIHIGLLCVQENVANRPTMTSVVTMLSSSSLTLPIPSKPAFFMHSITNGSKTMLALDETNHSKTTSFQHSTNDASITELHPR
ncbi:LOW QUALITY PROTEIN: putative receptor-like protein kinase At4g00960 [Benincasa hispida]|uniref:LOW QUALITY PROTEIN: putative receptor-like protein kinase At4g00960 n=1 Tax=Benincasa hispida TaxID=102211 RepID=UPI0019005B4A|nr:LOW QUALITY PROTEIN: putative receptor-like protein kinase At4g00960 [Benincasa hispida]